MIHFISTRTSQLRQFLIVTGVVCSISLFCFLLSNLIDYKITAFILFVTVSIIAMLFDIFPVLLSALLSALIWDYFFIPPRFTFHIGSTEDTILLLTYFLVAMVNAVLTFKIRQVAKVAREEEQKANAVKLYSTLFNSLSHELRTPISTIIGATDHLLNAAPKLSEQNRTELLREISKASIRLDRQVGNLLSMSRLESGLLQCRKDWCDVNELVHNTLHQLDDHLAHHKVVLSFEENLPLFRIDFGLMQQVLNNLISNSATYTQAGSTISVSATVSRTGTGECLLIRVEDNGPGFPAGEADKIFEKFYRLKNSRTGGTGLGLSIAKGFVEAHEGTIVLSSSEGKGSCFIVTIPAETSYLNREKNE